MNNPKVAIVHEFLTIFGGAEKTLEAIAEIFPDAPIFTARLDKTILPDSLKNRKFISPNEGFVSKISRYLFTFLMAPVFESFDFSDYDLIISDGNTWNKGILTKPDQLHITYVHTPPRFLYKYSTESTKRNKWYFKFIFSYLDNILRIWDYVAAQRPDYIIANSEETKRRIYKFYRKDSQVIYPPVEINYKKSEQKPNLDKPYYIAVGRIIKYKNFDLLVRAFNLLDMPLVIVGKGSYEKNIRKIANENIIFKGWVSDEEKHTLLENALGLINPVQDEDFGIVPVEAMAHGIPVLGHKSGGHLETIEQNVTGMLFDEISEECLIQSIKEFDNAIRNNVFDKEKIIKSIQKYSSKRFKEEFRNFTYEKWEKFSKDRA